MGSGCMASVTQTRYILGPTASEQVALPVLDDAQASVVQHRGGPLLVVGGPGTGKTTVLVESVASRVGADGDLSGHLVLTWSRPAAQALRQRLVARVGRSQLAPKVMTVHGFCHSLVRRFGLEPDESGVVGQVKLLTAPEQEFRVRELLGGHDTSAWPTDLLNAVGTRAFAGEVRAVLARTRQLGMDPAEVVDAGQRAGRPEWQAIGDFFDDYLDVLDAEQALDYAELVHRCRLLLLDETVRATLQRELVDVHVDEFAECDASQVALLGDVAELGLDVVAFGDPTTAVFGFRGADKRAILDFDRVVARTGRPSTRIDLLVNHRAEADLVRACSVVQLRLPAQGAAPAPVARPGVGRGRVRAVVYESPGAQVEHVAELLRHAHLEKGMGWHEMAVLTRSGRGDLPGLTRALSAAGVPVEVAGDDIALAEEIAVRPMLLALELALELSRGVEEFDPDQVARLLRSPLGGLDSLELRRLGRLLRVVTAAEGEIPQPSGVLVAALVRQPARAALLADEQGALPMEALAAVKLGELLAAVAGRIVRGAAVPAVLWELWQGTGWRERLLADALRGGSGAQRAHRDADAVCALFDLAAREQDLVGDKGVRALLAEVQGQAIPEDTARESDLRDRGVRLVTAHRVKGEQWRLVVVVGVQEGLWPNLARRGTLLEPDRLSRDGVLPSAPTSEVLADERRLFLLACSRATETLVVTSVSGAEGEGDQPSRFLAELGVPVEEEMGRARRPMTIPALVAELRRAATDPASPPALREAAAARLARLADARGADGQRLAPMAEPGSWWGVLDHTAADVNLTEPGAPIILQSSQVESLLDCPRQWFLSRQARAEAGRSSAANLGTVVHVLAQHALADEIDPDELAGRLDEVWDRIDFDADWLSSSERAEAEAALERFGAWTEAMDSREVLGVEVAFRTTVDLGDERVVVTGSVDRLERDAQGRIRVVDFKTGRRVPTADSVRANDQIGIYQLAAQQGAFDDLAPGERRVGGAELVYLRKQDGQQPWPKVLGQPSLDEAPTLASEADDEGLPTWVHRRLARAARIVRSEDFAATTCDRCKFCAFELGCPARANAPEVAR
ncbi:ATP-dependent DNA helicase [Luteococcus sanguinis]